MIFVTVGTHKDGFDRLITAMDQVAQQRGEEVIMQIGATRYSPIAAAWFAFAPMDAVQELTKRARVIVSHAGAGSILMALHESKPLIVMPRQKQYHEVGDDHQVELAEALEKAGALLVAYEVDMLPARLDEAASFHPHVGTHAPLVGALRASLASICE